MKPETTPGVQEKLHNKKERQAYCYNRGTRELSPLRKGDAVVMLTSSQAPKWKKAQVEDQVDVQSYTVRTEDGGVFWRNRRHLKKYDPPPVTQTPKPDVGPSKITVTADGALKDSYNHLNKYPIVPAPALVEDPPLGVAAVELEQTTD